MPVIKTLYLQGMCRKCISAGIDSLIWEAYLLCICIFLYPYYGEADNIVIFICFMLVIIDQYGLHKKLYQPNKAKKNQICCRSLLNRCVVK